MPLHFGVSLRDRPDGLVLTRENYVRISKDNTITAVAEPYSDAWCKKQEIAAYANFDLNMRYFASLDRDEFSKVIEKFLKKQKRFVAVTDLNVYEGVEGYYIMVLDQYCQVYIGTSNNIKRRILQHWSKVMPFDRLVFGSIDTSRLSINSFRALDTTRLYAFRTSNLFKVEEKIIGLIPEKFICNRTIGGFLQGGLQEAIANRRTRTMVD